MKGFKKVLVGCYICYITGLFFLAVVIFGAAQIMEIIQIPLVKPLDYILHVAFFVRSGRHTFGFPPFTACL